MKRIFVFTLVMFLAIVSFGYCADYNSWGNTDLNLLLGREFPYDLIYLGAGRGGVSTITTPITALPASYSLAKVVASTKTLTLANGIPGQHMQILAVDATGTLTLVATTRSGWSSIVFDANGEAADLLYVDSTRGWVIVGYIGATITQANAGS